LATIGQEATFYFVGSEDDGGDGAWRLLLETVSALQEDGWTIEAQGLRGPVEVSPTTEHFVGGAHATLRVAVATAVFGVQLLGHACVLVPTGALARQVIGGGSNCHATQSDPFALARIITDHFQPRDVFVGEIRAFHQVSK
jgi:hypothetical protein